MTAALDHRLQMVLPSIIYSAKSGFMKRCYTSSNIRLLVDILSIKCENLDVVVFLVVKIASGMAQSSYFNISLENYFLRLFTS